MADLYDVTGQRRTQELQGGNFVPVIEVDYVTKPHGIKGTIVVPDADYHVENVQALLEAAAGKDETIAAL